MAVEVLWSDEAKSTFASNIDYIEREWSEKEVKKFILRTEFVLLRLEDNPELFSLSGKNKKVRRVVINKRVSLFYRYISSKKKVILLSFWNNSQDEKKRKF